MANYRCRTPINNATPGVTYTKGTHASYGATLKIVKPDAATPTYSYWELLVPGTIAAGSHTITWTMTTTGVANMTGFAGNLFAEFYLPNQAIYSTQHISGTTPWTTYSSTFTLAAADSAFKIWMTVDRAYGTAEFADIRLDGVSVYNTEIPILDSGICWNTSTGPTIANSKLSNGTNSDIDIPFAMSMAGLVNNTKYYVRSYATTQYGTSYGPEVTFRTLSGSAALTTGTLSSITTTSLNAGGTITSFDGDTAEVHGHVWYQNKYVTWANLVNVSLNGEGGVKKTGGVASTWDAGATSVETLSGDGWVEFNVTQLSTPRMIGLSNGNTDQNYTDIDFAIYMNANNTAYIYEAGSNKKTTEIPFTMGDVFRIAVEGTTVRYYLNERVLYTSAKTPVFPLLVDTSLYSADGCVAHVKLCTEVGRTNLGSRTTTGSFTSNITGLDPGTLYYIRAYATTGFGTTFGQEKVFVTKTQLLDEGICWNISPNPTIANYKLSNGTAAGAGVPFSLSMMNLTNNTLYYVRSYATTQFGTSYGPEVNFRTLTGGPATVTTGSITNITATSCTAAGSIDAFAGANATQHGHIWSNDKFVTWTNLANASLSGDGGVRKTGGVADTWDAGATSVETLSGNGWAEAIITQLSTHKMIGLANGNTDATYGDIDFAIFLTAANTIEIYESGTQKKVTGVSYAIGDKIRIAVEGTVIRYYHRENILYESTKAPVFPLCVDTSLYTSGATLSHIKICTEIGKTTLGAKSTPGAFSSNISGLNHTTLYYVRAYATTTFGTGHGSPKVVTTLTGATDHGFVYATHTLPTLSDSKVSNGARNTTGTFTGNLTGLLANTTYYVRPYVTSLGGTAYGPEVLFDTPRQAIILTDAASVIDRNSIRANGTIVITGDEYGYGISAHGFCVSKTNTVPTLSDTVYDLGGRVLAGTFSTVIPNQGTGTYYIRAYATNQVQTSYGNVVQVTLMNKVASAKKDRSFEVNQVIERLPSVTSGLIAHFPFDGTVKGVGDKNILDYSTWVIGTRGSQTGFSQNGETTCNSIIEDIDPFGKKAAIWQSANNDATSDADGGWNTASFDIDNTKLYRFSTWVRRKVLGDGTFYFGCRGYGTVNGVLTLTGSTPNTNPYFVSSSMSAFVNEWVLVVGHVYPHNTAVTTNNPGSGFYNTSGVKIASISNDFKWLPETTTTLHRSYLYNSTDAKTQQLWCYPRVDLCDGTEPSIEDLVIGFNGDGSTINPSINSDTTLGSDGVTVEEATTNIIAENMQRFEGWTAYSGATAIITQNVAVTEWSTAEATRIQTTGGTSTLKYYTTLVAPSVLDQPYAVSVKIKNVGKTSVTFRTQIGNSEVIAPGQIKYAVCSGTGNGTSNLQFRFQTTNVEDAMDIIVWQPQAELKSFATAFTRGVRNRGQLAIRNPFVGTAGSMAFRAQMMNGGAGVYKSVYGNVWSSNAFFLFVGTGGNLYGYYPNTSASHTTFNTGYYPALTDGEKHYAATWNGTNFKFYIDGIQVAEGNDCDSARISSSFDTLYLCSHSNGSYQNFGRMKDLSIYNRQLSVDEIGKLIKSSVSIRNNGDIYTDTNSTEGIFSIPSGAIYIPLQSDARDRNKIIIPQTESNAVYGDGSLWVGTATTNEYTTPTFQTSSADGGWLHWGSTGHIGTCGQNTNPLYIYNPNQTYSHWVANSYKATSSYLVYQRPSLGGVAGTRSLSVIMCMDDLSPVTQTKVYPAWNAAAGGATNGVWSSLTRIGNSHFYLGVVNSIVQNGTDDLVGIYVSPGYKVHFSQVQLERKPFVTPFVNGTRDKTFLYYNLYRDFGLAWNGNWTLIYWKKPIGAHNNLLTGYNISQVGWDSVSPKVLWFGKNNAVNNITLACTGETSASVAIPDINKYLNNWQMCSLVKNGNTITHKIYGLQSTPLSVSIGASTVTAAAADVFVSPTHGYDLFLEGYTSNPSNSYVKDLIVAKSALSDAEIQRLYDERVRMKDKLYVNGTIKEGM